MREFEKFVEETSNWYVRVNRRRFWRGADEGGAADKQACHSTLFAALRAAIGVMAPIVPFFAEELWQQAIRPFDGATRPSPPTMRAGRRSRTRGAIAALLDATRSVRGVISTALRLREESKLRVRQPLPSVTIVASGEERGGPARRRKRRSRPS